MTDYLNEKLDKLIEFWGLTISRRCSEIWVYPETNALPSGTCLPPGILTSRLDIMDLNIKIDKYN